jgi:hypothetical protein
LLSVAEQNDGIVLFALVNDIEESIPVDIRIIGTGNTIKDDIENYKFLGTVKLTNGSLIFHIFGRHSKDFGRNSEKKEGDILVLGIDEFINIKEKGKFPEMVIA